MIFTEEIILHVLRQPFWDDEHSAVKNFFDKEKELNESVHAMISRFVFVLSNARGQLLSNKEQAIVNSIVRKIVMQTVLMTLLSEYSLKESVSHVYNNAVERKVKI